MGVCQQNKIKLLGIEGKRSVIEFLDGFCALKHSTIDEKVHLVGSQPIA